MMASDTTPFQIWADEKIQYSQNLANLIFNLLNEGETLSLSMRGESSDFHRFSQSKVRQSTHVDQVVVSGKLIWSMRFVDFVFISTGNFSLDEKSCQEQLKKAQGLIRNVPPHPYCPQHQENGSDVQIFPGCAPDEEKVLELLLSPVESLDLAGIFVGGKIFRAIFDSKGTKHFFATELYQMDYSLYAGKGKAIKGGYTAKEWNFSDYNKGLVSSSEQLKMMDRPRKSISPGKYRTFLSPFAVNELVQTFNWYGPSYRSFMEGQSPIAKLARGEASLSPLVSLADDYSVGLSPRFNFLGELCPERILVIDQGKMGKFLVNNQSAKEFSVPSTFASSTEAMRCPEISPGNLQMEQVLEHIDTGLYLNHLHYLNWSDLSNGRVTGMTRFGAYWVENGNIVGPIDDLRFDDTFYNLWGPGLLGVTSHREIIASTSTYGERTIGGGVFPGMLIEGMEFTL